MIFRLAAYVLLFGLTGCAIPAAALPAITAGLGFGTAVVVLDTDIFKAVEARPQAAK